MGKRRCPYCFVTVPWTSVLAGSYEMECPACRAPLELSRYTRVVAGFGGIAGGMLGVHLAPMIFPGALWVTRIAAAIFGFGVISAMGVLLAGDLVARPKEEVAGFPHAAR